jgi:hypothetical protein
MNKITGWEAGLQENFSEGGTIQAMVPHLDYCAIVLDNAIYGIYGNSWADWSTRLLNNTRGTIAKRSVKVVNEEVYFMSRDGIWGWNGTRLLKLSKHIQSDINSYTLTNTAAENIRGEYWISFPSNNVTLLFDPDTIRTDDMGDGRVSFYKFTGYNVSQFLPYFGAGDTGEIKSIVNATAQIRMDILETGNSDKIAQSTTIPMVFRTKDMAFGNSQQNKIFRKLKLQLAQSTATGGMAYTIKHYANNKSGSVTYSVVANVTPLASGIETVILGVPPGIDGYTYGVYIAHDTQYDARFLGYSIEVDKRKY